MKKIGIVIAMDKEFQRIKGIMDNVSDITLHGKAYSTGRIGDRDIIMTQSGIGKVNAAVGTVELINSFHPDAIISTGVAGGAAVTLNPQEVVVASATCYHDVYCGVEGEMGQVQGLTARFVSDSHLLECAQTIDCGVKINTGLTVTGDWFVDSREKMQSILDNFPDAMAVDMESAAIAHVCNIYSTPFISFRIISDIPLKDNKAQMYNDFWATMEDKSFSVTKAFLESI